jgi:hypothetical protein
MLPNICFNFDITYMYLPVIAFTGYARTFGAQAILLVMFITKDYEGGGMVDDMYILKAAMDPQRGTMKTRTVSSYWVYFGLFGASIQ